MHICKVPVKLVGRNYVVAIVTLIPLTPGHHMALQVINVNIDHAEAALLLQRMRFLMWMCSPSSGCALAHHGHASQPCA